MFTTLATTSTSGVHPAAQIETGPRTAVAAVVRDVLDDAPPAPSLFEGNHAAEADLVCPLVADEAEENDPEEDPEPDTLLEIEGEPPADSDELQPLHPLPDFLEAATRRVIEELSRADANDDGAAPVPAAGYAAEDALGLAFLARGFQGQTVDEVSGPAFLAGGFLDEQPEDDAGDEFADASFLLKVFDDDAAATSGDGLDELAFLARGFQSGAPLDSESEREHGSASDSEAESEPGGGWCGGRAGDGHDDPDKAAESRIHVDEVPPEWFAETRKKLGVRPLSTVDQICNRCGAQKFTKTQGRGCCVDSELPLTSVETLRPLPQFVRDLFARADVGEASIRLNQFYAISSFGVAGERVRVEGKGVQSYKILGATYFRLLPPSFASEHVPLAWHLSAGRFSRKVETEREFQGMGIPMKDLTDELERSNSVFRDFKRIRRDYDQTPDAVVTLFPKPAAAEVCAILDNQQTAHDRGPRVLVAEKKSGEATFVSALSSLWEPLGYPLIYFGGEMGWEAPDTTAEAGAHADAKTSLGSYLKRFVFRNSDRLRSLTSLHQQWLVDMQSRQEDNRLNFLRKNTQTTKEAGEDSETSFTLPDSFAKSQAWFRKLLDNSLFLFSKYGPPTGFTTATTNCDWPEIRLKLKPGRRCQDDPLLVSQVFMAKVRLLLAALKKDVAKIGPLLYYTAVIEWQKRGLPHLHVIWKAKSEKLERMDFKEVDRVVKAEVSSMRTRYGRFLAKKYLQHKCGPMCWRKLHMCKGDRQTCLSCLAKCRKDFPKNVEPRTRIDPKTGYLVYRRRKVIDLLSVETNEALLILWAGHLNHKIPTSGGVLSYLFGYVFKGNDKTLYMTKLQETNGDEIAAYRSARYLSSMEAAHRIFQLDNHSSSPSVTIVKVITPQDRARFKITNARKRKDGRAPMGHLEAYFARAEEHAGLTMLEYYERHDVDQDTAKKLRRPRVIRFSTVNPFQGEKFYLTLLLKHGICMARGANGFADCLQGFASYEEAVKELIPEVLESTGSRLFFQEELSLCKTPERLRWSFAMLLLNSDFGVAEFEEFWPELVADYDRKRPKCDRRNFALFMLERALKSFGAKLPEEFGGHNCPANTGQKQNDAGGWSFAHILEEEDTVEITTTRADLSPEQQVAYDVLTDAVTNKRGGVITVEARAGAGKTYFCNTWINAMRKMGKKILAGATTGIAASELFTAVTMHKLFRMPIAEPFDDVVAIDLQPGSKTYQQLIGADAVLIDEFSMMDVRYFYAVDYGGQINGLLPCASKISSQPRRQ